MVNANPQPQVVVGGDRRQCGEKYNYVATTNIANEIEYFHSLVTRSTEYFTPTIVGRLR